jgi:hypothetical protein
MQTQSFAEEKKKKIPMDKLATGDQRRPARFERSEPFPQKGNVAKSGKWLGPRLRVCVRAIRPCWPPAQPGGRGATARTETKNETEKKQQQANKVK